MPAFARTIGIDEAVASWSDQGGQRRQVRHNGGRDRLWRSGLAHPQRSQN